MIEAYPQFEIHQSGTKTGEKAEVKSRRMPDVSQSK